MRSNNIYNYKISTIIPVYNSENFIEQTLTSITQQTHKPYEIIIVNDNSNDNTLNICKNFSKIYNYIKIINLKNNMGVSYARNIGIKFATGDYIHFIDSDDTIELNMYQEILDNIENNFPDIVMTGTRYNENGNLSIYMPIQQIISTTNEMQTFIKENCISGRRAIFNVVWNKFYKKEFIEKNNLTFDENINFGEDFLFNCKCLKQANLIYVISGAYYNYIIRPNLETLKMKFINNKIELRKIFYREWINLYKFYGVYDDVKEQLQLYEGYKIYMAIISVINKNVPLNFEEKLEYIKNFTTFENSECLFKYMTQNKDLHSELQCLLTGRVSDFFNIINNKK